MTAHYCTACGAQTPPSAAFCPACGSRLSTAPKGSGQEAAPRIKKSYAGPIIGGGLGLILALWFVGSTGSQQTNLGTISGARSVATATPKSQSWSYSETKDPMRGTSIYRATVDSADQLNLPAPYGPDIAAHIEVRKRPTDALNVLFTVDRGQILCSDYSRHRLHFKFDDGPVKSYSCENASDGTNDVAFVASPAKVLSQLRASKRVMIEAEFFDAGSHQLTFDTAGLNWHH